MSASATQGGHNYNLHIYLVSADDLTTGNNESFLCLFSAVSHAVLTDKF